MQPLLALLVMAPTFPTGRLYYSTPKQVWVAEIKSGRIANEKPVKNLVIDEEYRMDPIISPDGRFIVFRRFKSYFLHDLKSGQNRLLEGIANWWNIRWAPDNRHLLGAKSHAAFYQYTLYDTATAKQETIEGEYSRADWLPDGTTLLLSKVLQKEIAYATYPGATIDKKEVDRLAGPFFRQALRWALVPTRKWQYDSAWADLHFSPSRRLAVYTQVHPMENSFFDDGNVPTMASYTNYPMYSILRDAKGQRSKTDIGSRNGFVPIAWSKDETVVLGRQTDYTGELAILRDGKLHSVRLKGDRTVPFAFFPN